MVGETISTRKTRKTPTKNQTTPSDTKRPKQKSIKKAKNKKKAEKQQKIKEWYNKIPTRYSEQKEKSTDPVWKANKLKEARRWELQRKKGETQNT